MGAREKDLNPDTYIGLKLPMGYSDSGYFKVKRGGSWANFDNNIQPSYRDRQDPYKSDDNLGFRVVRRAVK